RLPGYCPESMVEFWVCINSSLPGASKKPEGWVGLGCCELAIAVECRRACKQASSKNDLKSCRKEYEVCMINMGSLCCSYAGRHTNCREYCQAIFRTDSSPSQSQIRAVENYCASISPQLIHCVDNYTRSYPMKNPIDSLYCCDRAEDHACQSTCRRVLMTMATEHEIVDGLIEGCKKMPLPQDPLWQCFLESSGSNNTSNGLPATAVDGAKLHCCSKANTSVCRDLCIKLYSTRWGSATHWQEFDRICEYNPQEASMFMCLADVREPCQLGCQSLKYCTNFNNRPTELFRSCNAQSDQGAKNDMKLWEKGTIKMPFMNIPVQNIKTCQPEMWKAVACSLQIKPCHSKSGGSVICKSDCLDILRNCGDHSKFPDEQTAETICDLLSPSDDSEYCIPLSKYLAPSPLDSIIEEVIHPCNPNPCANNQVCEVNRKGCLAGQECLPFLCVQGCKLGEASDFLVRLGNRIQLPVTSGEMGCYKVCTCGPSGRLETCMEMPCIDVQKTCIVGGQRKNHGTSFRVDCNTCSCFAGDLSCSSRQCLSEYSSPEDRNMFTGLPCNCADQFVPVCALNGRTYPSACIARCVGLQDNQFEFGSCASKAPCTPNRCPKNERCIPKPKVCLTGIDLIDCDQYECISRPVNCELLAIEPVCDTENVEHINLCALYQRSKTLSYTGPCQDVCRYEAVCGHNGETYNNVCAAYSDRVAVDYYGSCQAVGILSDFSSHPECSSVTCPSLPSSRCKPVTPPGACCPLCAGMLRVLWSNDQLDSLAKVTPVSVHDILHTLRLHISVPQCDIFGYLSIESDLVILIIPVGQDPTTLQIEACNKEAEKIDSLINTGSPALMAHVPLSALTTSQVQVSLRGSSGSAMTILSTTALLLNLLVCLFCKSIQRF
uniref:Reversion-inducing cysteine-rich protein with Kazal motifs n=1 Tax=Callorhinchus milii TaxID=7868 RepID=A0A4W3JZY4_CALMI